MLRKIILLGGCIMLLASLAGCKTTAYGGYDPSWYVPYGGEYNFYFEDHHHHHHHHHGHHSHHHSHHHHHRR
ncbi:hypothetical protein [Halodesulfovibrio marinisediminis]|uniref:Lipoprotein n=1 Tax=Halodesulfovibrio marinisediminis DSM 17456 TaxID=1121457 RepID=A0A1N6IB09_9BACT|nr:hypothetical protein [Halodesulfovibrio marinisediminis]SIO29183.1 hypothetical protein SAMN02745161_2585 [Halodesulfovibrio marinisediminis DSM 17456]